MENLKLLIFSVAFTFSIIIFLKTSNATINTYKFDLKTIASAQTQGCYEEPLDEPDEHSDDATTWEDCLNCGGQVEMNGCVEYPYRACWNQILIDDC